MLQLAFCVLLSAGLLASLTDACGSRCARCACACARRCARPGASCASASCSGAADVGADGLTGDGEAAPLEPYDGVPLAAVRGRARRLRAPCCATRRPARPAPSCSPRAAPSADLPAGARGDRPRAVGPRGPAGRPSGRGAARAATPRAACRSTRRSAAEDRAGAAAQAAAARRGGLRVREGQGRASATTPGGWPRCAPRSGPASPLRLDANGAWGTVEEARGEPARARARAASSWPRSRSTASRRCARVRGRVARRASRWTRRRPSRAPPASGAADAVCLKIARCGGITGAAARRRAPPGRRAARRLPRLDLRRAARRRRRRARGGGAGRRRRGAAGLRPRDAGRVRGPRGRAAPRRRRDRGAGGSGTARLSRRRRPGRGVVGSDGRAHPAREAEHAPPRVLAGLRVLLWRRSKNECGAPG